jgi:hypothetical protein
MAKFEAFGREMRFFLACDSTETPNEVARRIIALGSSSVPPLFRSRSESELTDFLVRAKGEFNRQGDSWFALDPVPGKGTSEPWMPEFRRPSWIDTRSGFEMYFRLDDHVPVRVNVSTIACALAYEDPRGGPRYPVRELWEVMEGPGIEDRRTIGLEVARSISNGDFMIRGPEFRTHWAALTREKEAFLDRLQAFFEERLTPGGRVPRSLHYFARAISFGHPNPVWFDRVFDGVTGEEIDLDEDYTGVQLTCDWNLGVIEDDEAFYSGDKIQFKGFRRVGSDLTLLLESDRGTTLTISPVFCASFWNQESGVEIPAECWVNGPFFEVKIEKSDHNG